MNYLDIVIAAPLLYGLLKGFSNGIIKEITGLLSLVIGIYIAVNFSILLEPYLSGIFNNYEQFKPIIAFAILFLATILIIKLIGKVLNKLTQLLALGFISKVFGAIFGLLKIGLIVSFLLTMEARFELIPSEKKQASQLYEPTLNLLEVVTPHFAAHKNVLEKLQDSTKDATKKLKEKLKKE